MRARPASLHKAHPTAHRPLQSISRAQVAELAEPFGVDTADVVATVLVLQALERLSDRDAVRHLQTNVACKAAAGLALTDEAFPPTVLTLWRNKLRASKAPQRIFDAVRVVIAETGVLAGKTRRAADSTVLDDAVARQDTIGMLVAQIRRVHRRATRRRTDLVGQRLLSIRRRLLFAMPTTGE